eukprot:CAMPEP_0117052852 /NCGR_PEP_ID=MMETSP0472-20121206/36530_1 /TAXON_ID=693140 ORGANISM="Tiarina fusus, Strain LIS" /NCGR_SAMPLE_ID=MMETSP0472 /ASSEMBLY_ACC=CAM_ASM_000603 /LENGTH=321 /DNA_ID=CAMNT_0004767631 /DNA_START=264 /DNA_END=1229 /DNA_ORIENTATION=-
MLGSILYALIHIACIAIPIAAALLLEDAKKILAAKEAKLGKTTKSSNEAPASAPASPRKVAAPGPDLSALEAELKKEIEEVEKLKASLKAKKADAETKLAELTAKEAEVGSKVADVESKEKALESREAELDSKEAELKELGSKLDERDAALAAKEASSTRVESTESTAPVSDDEAKPEEAEEEAEDDAAAEEEAERAKRKKMIDEELDLILKKALEELEDEDEFEPEAVEALKLAAAKITYLKKYYDVMRDEVIYFPSVAKCIINYTLMEEAEPHYFDEDDEFPADYSGALREVATGIIGEEDDDAPDEDYMAALAMDVAI